MSDVKQVTRDGGVLAGRSLALVVASLVAWTTGCATTVERRAYSPEALIEAARSSAPTLEVDELVVPYEVSDEMVERARELTRGARSDYERAKILTAAITDGDGFGLEYEPVATAPAMVTVERGYGNCLSLISIFIGLARELGLEAYYVDASERVNEIRRESELIVDSGHIAAAARTEPGWRLVDYDGNVHEFRTLRIIDDITALAHYYNNLGYELINQAARNSEEVPWPRIRRSFELATLVRPGFDRAHNNLGVTWSKLDRPDRAEEEYMAAIAANRDFAAAYHNLANLRLDAGDLQGAVASYDRAVRLKGDNPFLHYHRGMALYRQGDMLAAADALETAIRLKNDYVEPRYLLAQVYEALGRSEDAAKIRAAVRSLFSGTAP